MIAAMYNDHMVKFAKDDLNRWRVLPNTALWGFKQRRLRRRGRG
jgi:hypothetical protein